MNAVACAISDYPRTAKLRGQTSSLELANFSPTAQLHSLPPTTYVLRHLINRTASCISYPQTTMWSLRVRPPSFGQFPARRALGTLRRTPRTRLGPRNSIVRPEPIVPSSKAPEEPQRIDPAISQRADSSTSQQPESAQSQPQDAYNPNYDPSQNTLLSPVHIPEDPSGVLKENHPSTNLLSNSGLVVQRQLEMMNVMV